MAVFIKVCAGLYACMAICMLGLTAPAMADSGPVKDPTGCATGSAVAACRNLPPQYGGSNSGQRLRPSQSQGLSNGDRLRQQSPLPSEGLRDRTSPLLPPPGSTGLGGGSTGIDD